MEGRAQMKEQRFDWTRGKPKATGGNETILPKTFSLIKEDFGQKSADDYLALCERRESTFNTIFYAETPAARAYRQTLPWRQE
jgi:hypothetical protein